jgi:hypothetical protein
VQDFYAFSILLHRVRLGAFWRPPGFGVVDSHKDEEDGEAQSDN